METKSDRWPHPRHSYGCVDEDNLVACLPWRRCPGNSLSHHQEPFAVCFPPSQLVCSNGARRTLARARDVSSLLHRERGVCAVFLWDRTTQHPAATGPLEVPTAGAPLSHDAAGAVVGSANHCPSHFRRWPCGTAGCHLPHRRSIHLSAFQFLAAADTGRLPPFLSSFCSPPDTSSPRGSPLDCSLAR